MRGKSKNTIWFVVFLVLAGVLHVLEDFFHNVPYPDYSVVTMLFCMVFMIYTVLLISWIQSVHNRLLPSKARSYMIVIAILMILYLAERAFKYRIAGDAPSLRLCWYSYYLPMTLIPTMFLMVCIQIGREEKPAKWDERLLLLPAGFLSGLILTNDLHHVVFRPKEGIGVFYGKAGTYTYGITFYLTYAWMILTILVGIGFLIRACGLRKSKKKLLYVAGIAAIWYFLIELHKIKAYIVFIPPYESPEIHIFSMLAIFEFCIREGLIPHNENYAGFFSSLPMPVMITDAEFRPVFRSANEIAVDRTGLEEALTGPTYPFPDQRLSGRNIRGGHAFWMEDESEVRKANERLLEANEFLESENTLIEYENRQKEQNAYFHSRHHIYHEIAEKMYPYQKRIEELLNLIKPGEEDFKERIAEVSVLNAYVKRKTNLLLMASEKEGIPLKELLLAVSESGRYLSYAGLKTSVDESGFQEEGKSFSDDMIIALYDSFEVLAEWLTGRASLLMVSFDEEGMKLAADVKTGSGDAVTTVLPLHCVSQEGIVYLTILAKKGGD